MLKHIFLVWIVLIGLSTLYSPVSGLDHLIGSPLQKCLTCICFARTGRADKRHCSLYPFNKIYWRRAGSPSVSHTWREPVAFRDCRKDENCALNTIKGYTESYAITDCNNDGIFDCKDRFATHLFHQNCQNRIFGAIKGWRFNECMGYSNYGDHTFEIDPRMSSRRRW